MTRLARQKIAALLTCVILSACGLLSTAQVSRAEPTPPPSASGPRKGAPTEKVRTAAKPTVSVSPSRPIVGERTKLSGAVATRVVRPIRLERKSGSVWKKVAVSKTSKKGAWSFNVNWRWPATSEVRVRLPKAKVKKKKYIQIISSVRKVAAATQEGKLTMPTWFEVGQKIVVTAQFSPVRTGRKVQLQVQSEKGWTTVAMGKQDTTGLTSFARSTSAKQVAVYRAVAATYKNAPTKATASVRAEAGVRLLLERAVTVGRGNTERLNLALDLDTVRSFKATSQAESIGIGLDQTAGVSVDAAMTSAAGTYHLRGDGIGCLGGTCNIGFRLTVTATVADTPPAKPGTEEFSVPSPDRIKAAAPAGIGLKALRDEVLVTLGTPQNPGSLAGAIRIATTVGAEATGGLEVIGVYELRWPGPVADMDGVLAKLRATDGVASAERSLLGGADTFDVTPDDWSDDGPAVRWPFEKVKAPKAWEASKGSDVPVGIVDSGTVWSGHEDLNVVRVFGNDPDNHATHVAGLACARQNNKGIVGAAWGCPITSAGLAAPNAKSILESATKVALTKPRVINMSLGKNQRSSTWCLDQAESDKVSQEMRGYSTQFRFLFNGPTGRDIVWTLAAGNNCGTGTHSWMGVDNWALPNVVTVASFNADKKLSTFSNFGTGVEVAGPGGIGVGLAGGDSGVISTVAKSCFFGLSRCSDYAGDYGTSMAAPVVAGVAALAIAASPDRTAAEIGSCLTSTAGTSTGTVTARSTYPGYINDMKVVPSIGFTTPIPIVDADAAVKCAKGGKSSGDLLITGMGDRTASGNGTDRGDLFAALTNAGYKVAISDSVPSDLTGFREVWYLDTQALADDEQDRLAAFVRTGRGLYLTGEWGCCAVDSSSIALINTLVHGSSVSHGGSSSDDLIDVSSSAPFGLGTTPNRVSTVQVASSGVLDGVAAENVVGTNDHGSTVIAAWGGDQVSGGGRIAIVMDINWVAQQYRGDNWASFVENLARFLK